MTTIVSSVPLFGMFQIVGFFVATVAVAVHAYRATLPLYNAVLYWLLTVIIGGLLGSIGYPVLYGGAFSAENSSVLASLTGITVVGTFLYTVLPRLSLRYADSIALSFPLWQIIGKIGCFYGGCCPGSITISFLQNDIPLQMVESGAIAGIAILLLTIYSHIQPGEPALLYILLYSLLRLCAEFYRAEPSLTFIDIRLPMVCAAALGIFSAAILMYRRFG